MRLRTLSTLLSDALSHLPSAEYERAKCEGLAAQVSEQRAHVENLVLRLEHMTKQRDQAEDDLADVTREREDAAKAYEAEKVAHGDTQRHLTAAIAERDEAQSKCRSVQILAYHRAEERADGWKKIADLEKRAEAAETRVAELQSGEPVMHAVSVQGRIVASFVTRETAERMAKGSYCEYTIEPLFRSQPAAPVVGGEPVAWEVVQQPAVLGGMTRSKSLADTWASNGSDVRPLYAAPQPAAPAYGVEGELFVCWEGACMWLTDDDGEGARDTGTRAEVEARAKKIAGSKVMRLVDADAPVVDVAKIREVVADLGASYPRLLASESAHLLRAAIGEKA